MQDFGLYKVINYYDKFDDELKVEQRKTLISKEDSSTFVIEEKGKEPVKYYIIMPVEEKTMGLKDEPVNIVGRVYGYQEAWYIVRYDDLVEFVDAYGIYKQDPSEPNQSKVFSFFLLAVHRTITTQFTKDYLDEMFWIEDESNKGKLGKDVNRIIYRKD